MVEPHAAFDVLEADVGRQPVLIARPFAEESFEQIVADLSMTLEGRIPAWSIAWLTILAVGRSCVPFGYALESRALSRA